MMQVEAVHKSIDGKLILQGASFTIEPGRIIGLVGRNGTGKTTLMRTMSGIYNSDQGRVLYEGMDIHRYPAIKQNIVFTPDTPIALEMYTIRDCAKWYSLIYPSFDSLYFTEAMKRFNLSTNKRISTLSKGTKLLVSTILGLSTKARLLLFDEPTNGLDYISKSQLLSFIVESLQPESAIVISSHMLNELDRIADKVILLQNGQTDKTVDVEQLRLKMKKLQLVFSDPEPPAALSTEGVFVLRQEGRVFTVILESEVALAAVKQANPLLIDELPLLVEDWFAWKSGGGDNVEK